MRSLSVEARIILLIVFLLLAGGLGGARLVGAAFEAEIEREGAAALVGAAHEFQQQERSEIEKLSSTLDVLLNSDRLARAFVARDRERLLALTAPLFETMRTRDRITHWYFIESPPVSKVFLRVHRPELHSDVVERTTFLKAVATGDLGAGKELGQTAFALRVVRPWHHEGKLIGYMELAEEIDHFLTTMKARTGDEYGILVKKEFLNQKAWSQILGTRVNTWNDRPDVVAVDTTIFNLGIADYQGDLSDIPEGGKELEEIVQDGRAWIRGIFPIRDAADRKVGGLFVLRDFTRAHRAVRTTMLRTSLVMAGFAIFTGAALALAIHLLVFRRLGRLAGRLERLADDAGTPPERVVQVGARDELTRIDALFDRLIEARRHTTTGGVHPRAASNSKGKSPHDA